MLPLCNRWRRFNTAGGRGDSGDGGGAEAWRGRPAADPAGTAGIACTRVEARPQIEHRCALCIFGERRCTPDVLRFGIDGAPQEGSWATGTSVRQYVCTAHPP